MRIINFKTNNHPADALYHCNKILKITDYIKLFNCMFVIICFLIVRLPKQLSKDFKISK